MITTKRVDSSGKMYIGIHSAMDINGNKVLKIFYADGTTAIVRGSRTYEYPMADKFYSSLSGLYGSNFKQVK